MKLFELFDKPVHFTLEKNDNEYVYSFSVDHIVDGENYTDDYDVYIELLPDDQLEYLEYKFKLPIVGNAVAYVSFRNTTQHTYSDLNFSDKRVVRIVFSTVISILKDYLRKHPDTKAFFFDSESSRHKLYKRLGDCFGTINVYKRGNEYSYYVELE